MNPSLIQTTEKQKRSESLARTAQGFFANLPERSFANPSRGFVAATWGETANARSSSAKSWCRGAFALIALLFITFTASADSLTNVVTPVANTAASLLTNNVSSLTTPLPTALPDAGASVFRVLGALILVIAVFLGGVWLFKNWQRVSARKGGGAKLNLLEVKSLGQRQAIYVVGYQQQRMLLASSPTGVTLLSHLPAADETETAAATAPAAGKMSFAEAFQQVLSRKQ